MSMDWVAHDPFDFEFQAVNGRLLFGPECDRDEVQNWIKRCVKSSDEPAAWGYGEKPVAGSFFVERYLNDGNVEMISGLEVVGALQTYGWL